MSRTGAESAESAWRRILRGLERGEDPETRYALPVSFTPGTGARRLPPVVRDLFAPPIFIVVDLENLCVRYEAHARQEPATYPRGALALCREHLPAAVQYAADAFDVAPGGVVIAAKSRERAMEVLDTLPAGWSVKAPDIGLKRGDSSEADDKVAIAFISHQAGANPAARFVLISEDHENLGVLRSLHLPHLVVWTPFEAPRGVRRSQSDEWTVRENLLAAVGAPRPSIDPARRGDRGDR